MDIFLLGEELLVPVVSDILGKLFVVVAEGVREAAAKTDESLDHLGIELGS